MKKIVSLSKIIHIIQTKGVSIGLENRRQLGFNTYKTKNHCEILGFWNKADNCLWDAQLLGYKKQFSYDDIYYSNIVIGYIKMPNNNDKLLMNIFFLHMIPNICAQMHCDKHVIKMILETCQMLCSAWHIIDPEHNIYTPPYKLAHKNHPCSVWTRESTSNYKWLCELGLELSKEYTYRYGKVHKSQQYIEELSKNIPPIPDIELTKLPQAMPEMYKDKDDAISAYRHYYFFEKERMHSWKGKINGRKVPEWITDFHNMFIC